MQAMIAADAPAEHSGPDTLAEHCMMSRLLKAVGFAALPSFSLFITSKITSSQ